MPLQGDIFDAVRAQRTLWCAFNHTGRPQDVPVPAEAPWGWRLRLSTDEPTYGGAGLTTAIVPPADQPATLDAPKRLLAAPMAASIARAPCGSPRGARRCTCATSKDGSIT
jgi:hypothetical protein